MRETWLIAKREYLERVRSKAFRISTLVIPVVFAIIFGIGALSGKMNGSAKHIVVASNDAGLAEAVRAQLATVPETNSGENRGEAQPAIGYRVDVLSPAAPVDLTGLNRRVEGKEIDGYLWLAARPGHLRPDAVYVSRASADLLGAGRMQNAIGRALAQRALTVRGMSSADSEKLLQDVDLTTKQVKSGQVTTSDAGKSFWRAYGMAFVLYFAIVFYGMNVAQSVASEKSSRVFEVLLSTTAPESMMGGKLLGVGAAGLTQMGIWIAAMVLLAGSSLATQLGHGGLAAYGVTVFPLVFFVLYFLLGFFFYSALSAGFGATVSQESEVQQFAMVLVLPLLIGLMLTVYILGNPAAWPVVLLSMFPPCAPIVMTLRMAAMAVPWWQLVLSVVLMIGSTGGVLWIASRIYRVGILMYGKRATLPEIVRWLRYS